MGGDYRSGVRWRSPRRLHGWAVGSGLLGVLAGLTVIAASATDATRFDSTRIRLDLPVPESVVRYSQIDAAEQPAALELVVRSGDSLAALFDRNALSPRDLHGIMLMPEAQQGLRMLRPGDTVSVIRDETRVVTLERRLDEARVLQVWRRGEAWDARIMEEAIERRLAFAHGVIDDTLYAAARDAGLSENITMRLAELFGWDVDFALEIRSGDEFTVIYEELWRDGQQLRDGEILAATFVNRGQTFEAIRFVDPLGRADYFDASGDSVRKAFLRAPVDFRYISSGFNPNRMHPILGVRRPHQGVDYSAASGTPIVAAGEGRIIFRGVKGGYGNCVILQHGETYSTLYGHMSRFAAGQRVGSRIRQGVTIGYVGQTGLATAAHLHYEFRVDGSHRNPRTVQLPDATPVNPAYRESFEASSAPWMVRMELIKRAMQASQQSAI
jgi:murein DD-endopeptidase MepM/ murein hydrolase activator NlpD